MPRVGLRLMGGGMGWGGRDDDGVYCVLCTVYLAYAYMAAELHDYYC